MSDFVVTHLRATRDARRLAHPERTVASYVFQEAEGVSRAAKLRHARAAGHVVHNLQHDGVVLALARDEDPAAVGRQLTAACTQALGYEQPVEVK